MISPQIVLVNGTPCHVKDLCRRNESTVTEEDKSDTLSGSEMGIMVTCESEGQHSSAQLTSEEDTQDEDDQTSADGGNVGNLPRRSTRQKQAPPPCHIYDHEIRGECSENWGENRYSPQHKLQRICSICKIYFFITLTDGMFPVTVPANAIYTYWVRAKGIDTVQSPDDVEVCRPYAVGHPVWRKPLVQLMYPQIQAWTSD